MAEHQNTVRTLYRHDWQNPEEWVQLLDKLARLTDAEISRLFHADVSRAAVTQN